MYIQINIFVFYYDGEGCKFIQTTIRLYESYIHCIAYCPIINSQYTPWRNNGLLTSSIGDGTLIGKIENIQRSGLSSVAVKTFDVKTEKDTYDSGRTTVRTLDWTCIFSHLSIHFATASFITNIVGIRRKHATGT